MTKPPKLSLWQYTHVSTVSYISLSKKKKKKGGKGGSVLMND
jgi:hypothetical protein